MKGVQHWRGPCDLKGPLFRTLGTSFHTVRGNHRLPFRFFFTHRRDRIISPSPLFTIHTRTHTPPRDIFVSFVIRESACVCVCVYLAVYKALHSCSFLSLDGHHFNLTGLKTEKKKTETKKKYIKETFHLLSTHDAHW